MLPASDRFPKLRKAPIVEAIVDIDCDLPPSLDFPSLESRAQKAFESDYPESRVQLLEEHEFSQKGQAPLSITVRKGVQAFQFLKDDKRQLVQVRLNGFSFNRLAPYSTLDDYIPEIARSWQVFTDLVEPLQVRRIALRCINRILLPLAGDGVDLKSYLRVGPLLPGGGRLKFTGFLDRHSAVELESGNLVNITLVSQNDEQGKLAVIFDIDTARLLTLEPQDWPAIEATLGSLRSLRNFVFRDTLTESCLSLFQH